MKRKNSKKLSALLCNSACDGKSNIKLKLCCKKAIKGTLSRVDMRRSIHPCKLKKFSLQDKYVYGFSTTLSCNSSLPSYFPFCPSCSFSHCVPSPPVDAILKVQVFKLKTSGWFFQVLHWTLTHVNPWQCPFKEVAEHYFVKWKTL